MKCRPTPIQPPLREMVFIRLLRDRDWRGAEQGQSERQPQRRALLEEGPGTPPFLPTLFLGSRCSSTRTPDPWTTLHLKNAYVSPPGGFAFRDKKGKVTRAPHIRAAVNECVIQHSMGRTEAEQMVLQETYQQMPTGVRDYFIGRSVGDLATQKPNLSLHFKRRPSRMLPFSTIPP